MKISIFTICLILASHAFASEDHELGPADVHEDHKEESSSDAMTGFSVSPQAVKNFELESVQLKGKAPWVVLDSAILYAGEEVNVYRIRDNKYSRIDFKKISQTGDQVKIQSEDLIAGDQIVTQGVGFLRILEIVSSGGMPHGHSH